VPERQGKAGGPIGRKEDLAYFGDMPSCCQTNEKHLLHMHVIHLSTPSKTFIKNN
jgi:hypothetical protein